jgi:hypothetical protein
VRANQEGNGYGTQSASGLHTRVVVCTGSGIGTQSASGLRTRIVIASGSALGSSSVVAARAFFRTASNTVVSTETNVRLLIAIRTSSGSASGDTDVALWKNAGKTLNGKLMMPPIKARHISPYLIRRR